MPPTPPTPPCRAPPSPPSSTSLAITPPQMAPYLPQLASRWQARAAMRLPRLRVWATPPWKHSAMGTPRSPSPTMKAEPKPPPLHRSM
eukprot:1550330-Prymnesium_polylepis.1